MTNFEKECVAFVSGYMEAGVSAEDYVKAFAERLLDVARDELNSRQGVKVESVSETPEEEKMKNELLSWANARLKKIDLILNKRHDPLFSGQRYLLVDLIEKLNHF